MISTIYCHGGFARAFARAAALRHPQIAVLDGDGPSDATADPVSMSAAVSLVALSSPSLQRLEWWGERLGERPWLGLFPFGANLVLTPVFRPGRPCVACFCRRLVSSPPAGLQQETAMAYVEFCGANAQFEQTAYPASAPSLAIELVSRQVECDSELAVVWGTANFTAVTARIAALHGCACRGGNTVSGTDRFVSFKAELSSWLN